MDFNITIYKSLLYSLQNQDYRFHTFLSSLSFLNRNTNLKRDIEGTNMSFLKNKEKHTSEVENKHIILRHDVDLLPKNSLKFAIIQSKLGIKGTYYFRSVPESWNENIIKEIKTLGHEVGYHYENMDTCNGDIDKAWDDFRYHLDKLRKLVEVKTICMHGSPRSKFDNKEIWNKYDYRSFEIIGEPYYDINFDEMFYLTDTGRRWDGWKTSVRDKVTQQGLWVKQGLTFHSTQDIIEAVAAGKTSSGVDVPSKIMFTVHPQRWSDDKLLWLKELLFQGVKNQVKRIIIKKN